MTTGGCLGVDGEGVAPHWRITECPTFDAKGTYIAATRKESSKRIPKGHITVCHSLPLLCFSEQPEFIPS